VTGNRIELPMNSTSPIDDRLTELEIKASFTEDLLERLDAVIVRQQQQIDSLTREIAHLKQTATSSETTEFRSLRDTPPPHY
jgi:SlyX protein